MPYMSSGTSRYNDGIAPTVGSRCTCEPNAEPAAATVEEVRAATGFLVEQGISVPENRLRPNGFAELPPVDSAAKVAKSVDIENLSASKIQPMGQLHDSFIIAVDDEGLLLIDQHVAHERILFDKYRKSETDRPIESQNLLLPETIDLSPAQSEAFRANRRRSRIAWLWLNEIFRPNGGDQERADRPAGLRKPEICSRRYLDTVDAEKRGSPKARFATTSLQALPAKRP